MALQGTDLLIVQRNQQSYKMPASEISSFVPPAPNVGDGTITIVQPGTSDQTFTVNQSGNATITLKNDNDNTTYTAGNGLELTGTEFTAKAGNNTITVDGSGISVNTANLPASGVTSITPGDGLLNGSASGATNTNPITGTGTLSVDDTVVRTTGSQTVGGTKSFSNLIKFAKIVRYNGDAQVLDPSNINLNNGQFWTCVGGAITNPSSASAAQSGLILFTGSATSWASNWKFPGGVAPEVPANSVVPYYIATSDNIIVGLPTPVGT